MGIKVVQNNAWGMRGGMVGPYKMLFCVKHMHRRPWAHTCTDGHHDIRSKCKLNNQPTNVSKVPHTCHQVCTIHWKSTVPHPPLMAYMDITKIPEINKDQPMNDSHLLAIQTVHMIFLWMDDTPKISCWMVHMAEFAWLMPAFVCNHLLISHEAIH